jgi:hypothetical protein
MAAKSLAEARRLFDADIKTNWPKLFMADGGEVAVYNKGGARYVPTQWANAVLKDGHNAWDVAIAAWSEPYDPADGESEGYDRIVEQAGPQYTWEGILIDPSRPWAPWVPQRVRENIKADLDRRRRNAGANIKARGAQAAADAAAIEAAARAKDKALLDAMSEARVADGKPPLSDEYIAERLDALAERRKAATA